MSCATSITVGWYGKAIDAGRELDRSRFPGGLADGSGEVKVSSTRDALLTVVGGWGCWETVTVVVEPEDELFAEPACCQCGTGSPPNADLNDKTIESRARDARVNGQLIHSQR